MRQINKTGLELVKRWEGVMDGDPTTVNLDPYFDPVGIWTIGWGHAIRDLDGNYIRGLANRSKAREMFPQGLTMKQAEDLLIADLLDASSRVSRLVRVPLNDNQFSALTSFEFNTGGLQKSTLLKHLNRGNYENASAELHKWIKGRNTDGILVTLPGLVSRRREEYALFHSPETI